MGMPGNATNAYHIHNSVHSCCTLRVPVADTPGYGVPVEVPGNMKNPYGYPVPVPVPEYPPGCRDFLISSMHNK